MWQFKIITCLLFTIRNTLIYHNLSIKTDMPIKNKVSIIPLDTTHVDSIYKHLNNEKLVETYPVSLPYSKEDANMYVENEIIKRKAGIRYSFAIYFNNQFAGVCALYNVDKYKRQAGLYYWVVVDLWNKGIASLAVKQIIDFAHKTLQLKKIVTGVLKRNYASIKVLQKNEFITTSIAYNSSSYHYKFANEDVLEMVLELL